MRQFRLFILLLGMGLLAPGALWAQLALSGYFGDDMVLQRQQPIIVWGTAAPGADVEVSLSDQKVTAKADDKGAWKAELKPMEASGPFDLKVDVGADAHVVKNIMIGDVWLISGQSNVVLALAADKDWKTLRELPAFNDIRICKMPNDYSFEPSETFPREVKWEVLLTQKAGYFSGVGYSFIRTIQPAAGVTVAIVQAAAGGTQIEQWTPADSLKAADPGNIQYGVREKALAQLATNPAAKFSGLTSGASALYNGAIYPMRFAKWKGVVWYQGEANSRVKADYRMLLKNYVQTMRKVFDEPDLPFVIIQLPNFGLPKDDGWMRLQESQMLAARDLNLPLVVTIDQGSAITIHPPNKGEVGRRAGLAAIQYVYKQDVEGTSPMPKSVTYDGGAATVEFDGFKGDLVLKGDSVQGFELAGPDGNFQPATAQIEGRKVKVTAANVPDPKAVRYLWVHSPDAVTLYSAAGLPAAPFRSQALTDKAPATPASP